MNETNERPTHGVAEWQKLLACCDPLRIRYLAGEMICQTGSFVAGIHLIVRGVVSESVRSDDGEVACRGLLGPGDLLGLESLQTETGGLARSLSRSVTATELLFVESKRFNAAIDADASLRWAVIGRLASRAGVGHTATIFQPAGEGPQGRFGLTLRRLVDLCGAVDGDAVVLRGVSLRTLGELASVSARQLRRAVPPDLELSEENGDLEVHGLDVDTADTASSDYSVSSMIDR